MPHIETCGAIYCGWDGKNKRRVATAKKSITFISEVMGRIDPNHKLHARLFYIMFRHGTTHLIRPHRVKSIKTGKIYSWRWYSGDRTHIMTSEDGIKIPLHHLRPIKRPAYYELPVSMACLCEDIKKAIKLLFRDLIDQRKKMGLLPLAQRRALTFIAEGVIEVEDVD